MYFKTKKDVSPATIVTAVLVILRIFKAIEWSWLWVLAPMWGLWLILGAVMWIGAKVQAWKR